MTQERARVRLELREHAKRADRLAFGWVVKFEGALGGVGICSFIGYPSV